MKKKKFETFLESRKTFFFFLNFKNILEKAAEGILGKTMKEFQINTKKSLKKLLPIKKFGNDFEKIVST